MKIHQNTTNGLGILSLESPEQLVFIPIVDYSSLILGPDGKPTAYHSQAACVAFLDSLEALQSNPGIKANYKTILITEWVKGMQSKPKAEKKPLTVKASSGNNKSKRTAKVNPELSKAFKLSPEVEQRVKNAQAAALDRKARLKANT